MRIEVPVAALSFALVGCAIAAVPPAPDRIETRIPAEDLAKALKTLAKERKFQILYHSSLVKNLKTPGASGSLTSADALAELLRGTGLTYRYLDDHTVTVVRAPKATAAGPDDGARASRSLHMTRADEAGTGVDDPSDSPVPMQTAALQEVVVTAEKRSERLVDAPVAVTALSSDTLRNAGVYNTQSLATVTPSLTFTAGNHVNNAAFRIRGVGTQVFGAGLEPDVSVVVDGVVLARAAQGFADLADIDHVEVLRGPQGTLFGKNAIAGVINVVTKGPSRQFEGYASATAAQGDEYRFHGTVSGPLSQTLSARFTGYYDHVGGNIYDVPRQMYVNGDESYGGRAKLLWQATTALDFTLIGDYRNSHEYCCANTFTQVSSPLLAQILARDGVVAGINNRRDDDSSLPWETTGQTTVSLTGNLRLDAGTLTSISAYQFFDFNNNQPVDGLNNTIAPLYVPVGLDFEINGGPQTVSQFTQELRFTSPGGARFNYLGGLYFLHLDVNRGFERRAGLCAPHGAPASYGLPCVVSRYESNGGFHSNNQDVNVAAYGQADLRLVGSLSALGGVRVQHERVSYWGIRTLSPIVPGDLPLPGQKPSSGSGSSGAWATTGKVGLRYAFTQDAQGYLTWSTGYKGAGYSVEFASDFVDQQPVKPETARAWELGYKTEMFEHRLRLNAALFYDDYSNLQVQANRGNPDLGIVLFAPTNAGSASSKGAELEFEARPVRSLTLSGGMTYLSTSVDVDGLQCALDRQAGAPVITSGAPYNTCYKPSATAAPIQNVHGGNLPQASMWRGDLTARYDHAIPGTPLGGFVQLSANSQSKFNYSIEQDPLTVQRAYTIVDGSMGFHDLDGRYQVTLFVDNIFDRHYLSLVSRATISTSAAVTPNNVMGIVPKDANRYFGGTVSVWF